MRFFTKDRQLTPSWSLVRPSIDLLKANIWQFLYLSFLPGLLLSVGFVIMGRSNPEAVATVSSGRQVAGTILAVVAGLWALLTYPGYVMMQLRAIRNQQVSIMENFKYGLGRLLPLIAMLVVLCVAILGGFMLLIVPGLLLLRGFYLAPYYLVERKLGPIAALKQSYQDSRPVTAWIWGLLGVIFCFGIVSGVLSAIPVIGAILSAAIGSLYSFAVPIRYTEVSAAPDTTGQDQSAPLPAAPVSPAPPTPPVTPLT